MNQIPDFIDVSARIVQKSHRVQVRKTHTIPYVIQVRALDGQSKSPKQSFIQPNLCESQQVGILRGLSELPKQHKNSDDILKHLAVVYLYTVLKFPPRWTSQTFKEIAELETSIDKTKLGIKLPIPRDGKIYTVHLSNTMLKGCLEMRQEQSGQIHLNIIEALARIKRGKSAIWKCDSVFFLISRSSTGWYFYTMNLQNRPTLMFFSCSQLMVNLVQNSYGCTGRSKYFLSNVVLHSVEDGDIMRIVWKMKHSAGMRMVSPLEALLHGNCYLVQPSLERSLEIVLNLLEYAMIESSKPRAWDNKLLNRCFRRKPTHAKAAEKIVDFIRNRNGLDYTIASYNLTSKTSPIGHRQRKYFEKHVSYLLASCTTLLVIGLDCCFLLWTKDDFIYWFSPYQYSDLQEKPEVLQHRASFLHMTNSLAKASKALFEYLYELGIFPDHTIELLSVTVDESKADIGIAEDDEDSPDHECLTIPLTDETGWVSFYSPANHSPSELRLARQMLDMVYRSIEAKCG
ncbi:uncharacterized protein LOC128725087 [Anopheles nili]|uniref:uncharacterized protein LOC128725087 n=1 Tax=Anopheles nili TaxID=185578 RepID=UPI00237B7F09|nr:uncharacterized protein LOC128725087 [Anopheles nili]